MKASEKFKIAIENYLTETAFSDRAFAPNLSKVSKNLESCINYIFSEVQKMEFCVFENQEIFDKAVKYYTDDKISCPTRIRCNVFANQPIKTDFFTPTPPNIQNAVQKTEVIQSQKPVKKTLNIFDL